MNTTHDPERAIGVIYTNHRREKAQRRITPLAVRWGSTEHHPDPQWLLDCYDHDREAERTYALADCDFPSAPPF